MQLHQGSFKAPETGVEAVEVELSFHRAQSFALAQHATALQLATAAGGGGADQ